jgi:hypothetical protein
MERYGFELLLRDETIGGEDYYKKGQWKKSTSSQGSPCVKKVDYKMGPPHPCLA